MRDYVVMPASHLLLLLVINVVWALNVVALKIGVAAMMPLASASIRYAIVLLCCLPFMRRPRHFRLIVITGLVAGAAYNGFNALGFRMADNVASLAIAGQLGIPFSLIAAAVVLGERLDRVRFLGLVLALSGVAIITFDERILQERLGLALVVIACALWASGNLLFRKLKDVSVLNIHGWLAVVALPCLAAASLVFEPGALARSPTMPAHAWGWIVFSALGSSILGHVGMSWLIQRQPISRVLPLTIPSPALSVIFAALAFDIPFTIGHAIGCAATLLGVAIILLAQSRTSAGDKKTAEVLLAEDKAGQSN